MNNNTRTDENYYIGQVLYIFSTEKTRVYPVLVAEQIDSKTLEGTKTRWMVHVGPPGNRKILDLSSLGGKKFTSIDEAKRYIMSSFEKIIDDTIAQTNDQIQAWYGNELRAASGIPRVLDEANESIEDIAKELGSQQSLPFGKPEKTTTTNKQLSKEEAREELKKAMTLTPEDEKILANVTTE